MRLHTTRVDLQRTRESWPAGIPFAPAVVLPKNKAPTRFFVVDAPLDGENPPVLADTIRDEYVRIPLFLYRLRYEIDMALAYMLQLAFACAGRLPKPVADVYIITGFPVDLVDSADKNDPFRLHYWFGIAFVLED